MRTGTPATTSSVTLPISRVGGAPIGERASSNTPGERSGSGVPNIGFAANQSATQGSSTASLSGCTGRFWRVVTVGYGEVHPLGTGGRVFTIGVIVASFATFVYAVSVVTNVFASGEAARHMKERSTRRMRDALSNHVIVVGFGRVGHAVVRSLHGSGRQCAVIDMNPEHESNIRGMGAVHVCGDATDVEDLRKAGID